MTFNNLHYKVMNRRPQDDKDEIIHAAGWAKLCYHVTDAVQALAGYGCHIRHELWQGAHVVPHLCGGWHASLDSCPYARSHWGSVYSEFGWRLRVVCSRIAGTLDGLWYVTQSLWRYRIGGAWA